SLELDRSHRAVGNDVVTDDHMRGGVLDVDAPEGVPRPRGGAVARHVGAETVSDDLVASVPRPVGDLHPCGPGACPRHAVSGDDVALELSSTADDVVGALAVPVGPVLDIHEPAIAERREPDDVVVDLVARARVAGDAMPLIAGDDIPARERAPANTVLVGARAQLDADPRQVVVGDGEAKCATGIRAHEVSADDVLLRASPGDPERAAQVEESDP